MPDTLQAPAMDDQLPRKRPTLTHYLMVLPAVILFSIFITLPAIQGVVFSFTNFAGYGEWRWIGWANYRAMVQDPVTWDSYRFTISFALGTAIMTNVIALFLAVLLNSKIRWSNAFKGIYFVPMVLSGLVVAYCFQYIFSQAIPQIIPFGPLGRGMLADPFWAGVAVVLVSTWQSLPGSIIIYLAGLSSVGTDIYEAGTIDGATAGEQFRYLTLPLLAPFVIINTVIGLKNALNVYDVIIGLTNGGPGTATRSIAMSIVKTLEASDYSYGSANAVVFAVFTILLSIAQLALIRRIGASK